jgi:polyhydroxybutyrate depolymerase
MSNSRINNASESTMPFPVSPARTLTCGGLIFVSALLAACGGSGDVSSIVAAPADQLVTTTVAGFPHAVDVYNTAGATRAIVLLHGGGGNKSAIAFQLGLNASATTTTFSTINWAWLDANKVMVVVPQGQNLPTEPNGTTWSNYAMYSGQDDRAFLQALAAKIRTEYGVSSIAVMGHSMGGVMVNRMWCESPTTFNAYISLAGPASAEFHRAAACNPGADARPYLGIIGDSDEVMQTTGNWSAPRWTVSPILVRAAASEWDYDIVINEFVQQQSRTAITCATTLPADGFVTVGNVDTWTSCGGRLVLDRVHGAEHAIDSIDAQLGAASTMDVINTAIRFLSAQQP